MKTLYILRHAKAERDSASGRDFDRPLAERGWNDARAIGREMRRRGLDPDAVAASPAKRAAETLAAVEEGHGAVPASYDRRIYDASADALLDIVREADDEAKRLLLVGHNPGFQLLLLRLTADDPQGLRESAGEKFPTAALAVVELPVDEWRKVKEGAGQITAMIRPGELD
jgi:phosphohistidine phosphatase